MLIYPDHIQNWLDFGYNLSIFSSLAQYNLAKLVKFEVSDHFIKKVLAWHCIHHADQSMAPLQWQLMAHILITINVVDSFILNI